MRLIVNDQEVSLDPAMVGAAATVLVCNRLGFDPSDRALVRASEGSYVGDTRPIGEVLRDGDELEIGPRPSIG
jgi:hypothetical protein